MRAIKGHSTCYVVGNGASRSEYSITHLEYPTFGCNQIYKDHKVNYLLAQDKWILEEMDQRRVTQTIYIPEKRRIELTRHNTYTNLNIEVVKLGDLDLRSWLTGELAILLAAQKGFDRIKLIGFDGGPDSWYRTRTTTNRDLDHCQVDQQRYEHSFAIIRQQYPDIKIITDKWFMQTYK